jgi:hypothetical protein
LLENDYFQTMRRRGAINARWLQYGDRRGDDASAKARKLIGWELGIALASLNGAGNGDVVRWADDLAERAK